jgi:hypothetical protein
MHGGRSYLPLGDILPPPAKDMINNIGQELDDDHETRHPYPRTFLTIDSGFQRFERKLQRRIISQQQYFEVIRNCTLGLFAKYKQSLIADEDMGWLHEHNYIVNPPTPG